MHLVIGTVDSDKNPLKNSTTDHTDATDKENKADIAAILFCMIFIRAISGIRGSISFC